MAIRFKKVVRNLVPGDTNSEKRVFPVVTYKYDTPIDLKTLSKAIAAKSVLGEGEVYNVLKYFCTYMQQYLLDGKYVNVDGFGCFYLALQGKGALNLEEFTTDVISGLRICFRASNDIRIHNGATTRTDGLHFIDVDKVNGDLDDSGTSSGEEGSGSDETTDGSSTVPDSDLDENPFG